MKKHKLRKYTESMKELNLQEQKEIEGGFYLKWSIELNRWIRVD